MMVEKIIIIVLFHLTYYIIYGNSNYSIILDDDAYDISYHESYGYNNQDMDDGSENENNIFDDESYRGRPSSWPLSQPTSSWNTSSLSHQYIKLDWYETSYTNYATDETRSQVTKVQICEDSPSFVASNCISGINEYQCIGNQMIKLFSKGDEEWKLEQIGKYQFCGTCSKLEFKYSTKKYGNGCKDFWVFAGCYGNEQCSGQLILEGNNRIRPTSQPTSQPSQPSSQYKQAPQQSSSSSSFIMHIMLGFAIIFIIMCYIIWKRYRDKFIGLYQSVNNPKSQDNHMWQELKNRNDWQELKENSDCYELGERVGWEEHEMNEINDLQEYESDESSELQEQEIDEMSERNDCKTSMNPMITNKSNEY